MPTWIWLTMTALLLSARASLPVRSPRLTASAANENELQFTQAMVRSVCPDTPTSQSRSPTNSPTAVRISDEPCAAEPFASSEEGFSACQSPAHLRRECTPSYEKYLDGLRSPLHLHMESGLAASPRRPHDGVQTSALPSTSPTVDVKTSSSPASIFSYNHSPGRAHGHEVNSPSKSPSSSVMHRFL